jgi:hypothetical protein
MKMARHSANDYREVIAELEGADKRRFLREHSKHWEIESREDLEELKELKNNDDNGEDVADYVMSFTGNGKTALLEWLEEAVENNLINDPYAPAEEEEAEEETSDEEEEEERPRRSSKRTTQRESREESEGTGKRGRKPLSDREINEIRKSLKRTKNIMATSEETGRARATILRYIDRDEREELGVHVQSRDSDRYQRNHPEKHTNKRTNRESNVRTRSESHREGRDSVRGRGTTVRPRRYRE